MKRFVLAMAAMATFAAMTMFAALSVPMTAVAGMDKPMSMTMTGYIIDTKCATNNADDLDRFVGVHTKECALLPACAASGYNLYSGGKLWKFDKESSEKVHEFLMKEDSTLHVKVEMTHGEGNTISLISIENAGM